MPFAGTVKPPIEPYQPPRIPTRQTPVERGELVRSEREGHVRYTFDDVPLPGGCARDEAYFPPPRTKQYHAGNVTPNMHEGIRKTIHSAYRRYFRWVKDEAPHVTFKPHYSESSKTIIEVTMAHRQHYRLVKEAEDLREIDIRPKGPYKSMKSYNDAVWVGRDFPPTLAVLAVKDLPSDFVVAEVQDRLWKIFSDIGEPCEVWNVLLDHRAQNIWGQRTGKVVIVGHTFQTYFEDCLQERVPSTFNYRGNEYPLACSGGRPRPREAQHSSSTGVLAGENSDSGIEID